MRGEGTRRDWRRRIPEPSQICRASGVSRPENADRRQSAWPDGV